MYKILHRMEDKLTGSISVLVEMKVDHYLKIINEVYKRNGGLVGQRTKLKVLLR